MSFSNQLTASRFNVQVPLRGGKILVYNTASQALVCLSGQRARDYETLAATSLPLTNAAAEEWRGVGIAVPREHDELLEARAMYARARSDNRKLQLVIAPTMACNFACDYCYQGLDKKQTRMDAAAQARIVDFVAKDYPNIQMLEVHWYGGEPLNDRGAVYSLSASLMALCQLNDIQYSASMVTNGYGLTGDVAAKLERLGVRWVQVTVDGPESIHDTRRVLLSGRGTYQRIIANLKEVLDCTDIAVALRCNVDTRNISHAYDLIDDLADEGFGNTRLKLYFAPVQTMTEECATASEFVEAKTDYAHKELRLMKAGAKQGLLDFAVPGVFDSICVGVAHNGWVVDPEGNLQKCFDTIQREDLRVGVLGDSAEDLADNPDLLKWRNWTPFEFATCRDCKLLPSCAGGCAYKFIHADQCEGDASRLPCPSHKFTLAERLFEVAVGRGIAASIDWDGDRSATSAQMVGQAYTPERHAAAVTAMDDQLRVYEQRIARALTMAIRDELPSGAYEKLGRTRAEFIDMSIRRLKTARGALNDKTAP